MNKYGIVSWNEPDTRKNNLKIDRDLFLKLENGSNELRILSKAHVFKIHKFKAEGMTGFGININCAGTDENDNNICPLCKMATEENREDLECKDRYMMAVLSRKDGRIKILEFGPGVYKDIGGYNNHKHWGSPETYDLDIVVNKHGDPKSYYTVKALPPVPSPLTEEELALKMSFDMDVLKRLCTPPRPEKVLERVKAVLEKINKDGSTKPADKSAKPKGGDSIASLPSA